MADLNQGSSGQEPAVLCSIEGHVATLVLNRPRALNALNTDMVTRIAGLLEGWAQQTAQHVGCVIVKGAGGKAFCAGGDVKWVVGAAMAGDPTLGVDYFEREYSMNAAIARLPLPYVSLMDGFVMGGGAGVSVHGHFRVVTERTVFAMPECSIGLWPDVGASFFLNRLRGHLGMYLGTTGVRLKGVDVRTAGLATHYVPSHLLHEVEGRLHRLGPAARDLSVVAGVLSQLEHEGGALPTGPLLQALPWIDAHFGGPSVGHIIESLTVRRAQLVTMQQQQQQQQQQQHRGQQQGAQPTTQQQGGCCKAEAAWLDEALAALAKGSPLSEVVTHAVLTRCRNSSLATCLDLDRVLARSFLTASCDFFEGVTAALIEKGRAPVWRHKSVSDVPPALVVSVIDGSLSSAVCARSPPSRM
ncbi:hypothetical protein FOA52_013779 [Chlamydomonas sp. UWO 241]|nr:hypothetical protein FOA52_013779 [Chlamydomonas sp. UWO 241]